MSEALSVVIPVHNEAPHLRATVAALIRALEMSDFSAELVIVDDGSTDASGDVVREAVHGRVPLTIVRQANAGRFDARRAGIERATADWVLLLDGRVRLRPESLAFVQNRIRAGDVVWNGHVHVETEGSPYGTFWNVLVELAWRDYFDDPRATSYDATNFDRYPKGTTCFLGPRRLLLQAIAKFLEPLRRREVRQRRHTDAPLDRRAGANPPGSLVRMRLPTERKSRLVHAPRVSSRNGVRRWPRVSGVAVLRTGRRVLSGKRHTRRGITPTALPRSDHRGGGCLGGSRNGEDE